jgi:excisionase family DNA binding protein
MTYQEAANYLRISLATIDRMVRAGEISSVLIRWTTLVSYSRLGRLYPLPLHPRRQMRPWEQRLRLMARKDLALAGRVASVLVKRS